MIGIVAAALMQAAAPVVAPAAPPFVNVRGEVVELTRERIVVRSAKGETTSLDLAPAWSVQVMRPMRIQDARVGRFVGVITAKGAPDRAVEAHVFSAGVKMGEGAMPWDRPPGGLLTQGALVSVTPSKDGAQLRLGHGGGEHVFTVPADAAVVSIDNEGRQHIRVGVKVLILGWPQAGGGLRADAVATGEGGTLPPL